MPVVHRRLDRLRPVWYERLWGDSALLLALIRWEVSSDVWAGRSTRHADLRDHDYGYVGAGVHFEPTIHDGFNAGYDVVRAIVRALVGAIG